MPDTAPTPLNAARIGNDDGFVAQFDSLGSLRQLSYLGTLNADQAFLLEIGPEGNVYVFGQTFGSYPVTPGVYNNPSSGQFIHQLSPALDSTIFSTVVGRGDNNPDISPTAFLVNDCGNIYLAGWGGVAGQTTNLRTDGLPTTTDAFRRATEDPISTS